MSGGENVGCRGSVSSYPGGREGGGVQELQCWSQEKKAYIKVNLLPFCINTICSQGDTASLTFVEDQICLIMITEAIDRGT